MFLVRDWDEDSKSNSDTILPGFPFHDEKDLYVLGAKLSSTSTTKKTTTTTPSTNIMGIEDDDVYITLFALNHATASATAGSSAESSTTATTAASSYPTYDDVTMYVHFECFLHEHDSNLCLTRPLPMELVVNDDVASSTTSTSRSLNEDDNSKRMTTEIKATTWQANISKFMNKQDLDKFYSTSSDASKSSSSLSLRVHFFLKKQNDDESQASSSGSSNNNNNTKKKKGSHYYRGQSSSPTSTQHLRSLATNNNNKPSKITTTASPTMVVTIPLSTGYVGVIGAGTTDSTFSTGTATSKDINVIYLQDDDEEDDDEEEVVVVGTVTTTARK